MKNKIIATVLVLVTLISIFVIPASAKSFYYDKQSSCDIEFLSFIENANSRLDIMISNPGASSTYSIRDTGISYDKFLPFTTTSMKNLYVFCNDGLTSMNDSLTTISPSLYFKTVEVYLNADTYAPADSVFNFNLLMDSPYYSKLKVQLLDEDLEVITSVTSGCGTSKNVYDHQAFTLFKGLNLGIYTWENGNWSYGATTGTGIKVRSTDLTLKHEFSTATRISYVKLVFDIGSYQTDYFFNFYTASSNLRMPSSDTDSDNNLKEYIEYTDNKWENVKIFFTNCGIFFENVTHNVISKFKTLPDNLKTWFNNVVTSIGNLPQNIADKIGGFFGGVGESIANYFKDTYLGQVFQITGALKDFLNNNGVSTYRIESPNANGSTSSDTTSSDFSDIEDNEYYQNPDIPGYLDYEYWQSVGE